MKKIKKLHIILVVYTISWYYIYVIKESMNVLLEKLFEKYDISEKDRYEILQMFQIMSDHKKARLLNNFETLAKKIEKISSDIVIEQGILLDCILPEIQKIVLAKK